MSLELKQKPKGETEMSADYRAYAIVGCEIPVKSLSSGCKQGCNCDYSIIHGIPFAFCPICGKKAIETKPYWYDENRQTIRSLNVPNELEVVFTPNNERCFVGIVAQDRVGRNGGRVLIGPNVKTAIKNVLESVGLWDESKYGLWAVQYCSY